MTVTMYGIRCDTIKKARAWLDEHGIAYAFHDYKAAGIDAARLTRWSRIVGWEVLLNQTGYLPQSCPMPIARASMH